MSKKRSNVTTDLDAIAPTTKPADAAAFIAHFVQDAPETFRRAAVVVDPPYYLPVGVPLGKQHRCYRREDAERVGLAGDYDAATKQDADYVRQLDAEGARLAKDARAVALLLASADPARPYADLQAMARNLESRPIDWHGAWHAFWSAIPAMDAGQLHYDAAAGKAIKADPQSEKIEPLTEDKPPRYEPKADSMEYNALKALWELQAFSRAKLKSSREMARHAGGSRGDPEYYKKGGRQLTAHSLAESSPGQSGGYWLTEDGTRTAKRLFTTAPERSPE